MVKELSERYKVTAYGCLGSSERVDKIKLFSESKFCVAMENSNAKSYVSEKVGQLVTLMDMLAVCPLMEGTCLLHLPPALIRCGEHTP